MLLNCVLLEKILERPLDCKEIQLVNPKGNQSLGDKVIQLYIHKYVYIYIYIYIFFFILFSIMVYHRILYIYMCVCVCVCVCVLQ